MNCSVTWWFDLFQVNDSLKRGDHQGAVKNSTTAKWLNVLAIISGLPVGGLILYAIIAR